MFGLALKLADLTKVNWSYVDWFYSLYSIFIAVLGFVCLVVCSSHFFNRERLQMQAFKRRPA